MDRYQQRRKQQKRRNPAASHFSCVLNAFARQIGVLTYGLRPRYLFTSLPRYLFTSLRLYLVTSLPRYLVASLPRHLFTSLPRQLFTSLPRYLVTSLPRSLLPSWPLDLVTSVTLCPVTSLLLGLVTSLPYFCTCFHISAHSNIILQYVQYVLNLSNYLLVMFVDVRYFLGARMAPNGPWMGSHGPLVTGPPRLLDPWLLIGCRGRI